MPIGSHLDNGFCSIHSSDGHNTQPQETLDRIKNLPKREGSVDKGDRHICPHCAYIQGYNDAYNEMQLKPKQIL